MLAHLKIRMQEKVWTFLPLLLDDRPDYKRFIYNSIKDQHLMPFDFSFTSVTRWFCKQNTLIDYYELSGEKDIFFKNVGSVNSTDTLVISNRETMTKWVPGLNPPPPRQWPRKQFSILSSHPTLQTPLPHHCQIVILPLTILRGKNVINHLVIKIFKNQIVI